jgi:hypothetical protein
MLLGGNMNAMNYLNVTSRLAYYDAMKAAAPTRSEATSVVDMLRKIFKRTPKQRRAVLVTAENLHA